MLSSRLIQLVEAHWDSITDRILRQIRADSRLPNIAGLPEGELRDRAQDILRHLGRWLTRPEESELAARFERIGQLRCHEGIPLHEVVLAYLMIKARMLEFVRAQGLGQTTVDIYAEEELEYLVGGVFDCMIYRVVRGYEEALAESAGAGPRGRRAASAR